MSFLMCPRHMCESRAVCCFCQNQSKKFQKILFFLLDFSGKGNPLIIIPGSLLHYQSCIVPKYEKQSGSISRPRHPLLIFIDNLMKKTQNFRSSLLRETAFWHIHQAVIWMTTIWSTPPSTSWTTPSMFFRTRSPPQLSRGDPLGRSELSFWKKNGRALCEKQKASLWRS